MAAAGAAMAGLSVVNGIMQYSQASRAGAAARDAASQNAAFQIAEDNRQQAALNEQAGQQMGDRARQADREASTLAVMMDERGASANAMSRSVQELGYFEGLDMSRIEATRKNKYLSLESDKTASTIMAQQGVTAANNAQRSAQTGAFLGTLGSFVQIGAADYKEQRYEAILSGGKSGGFQYSPGASFFR